MDVLRYYLVNVVVAIAAAGLWLGGGWTWLGIATFPVLAVLDIVLPSDERTRDVKSPFLADVPLYAHLPLMVALWGLFIMRLGEWTGGEGVSTVAVVGMILSVGYIGAVPNLPIAHELMHRRHWFPIALNKLFETVSLDPNRDMGHKLTHHIDLCTEADSDTPKRGQTIYTFIWQASFGAWKDGFMMGMTSLRKRGRSVFHIKNPLYVEFGLLGALFALILVVAGPAGLPVAFAAMLFAKLLTEGFNYLQHYGMVRVPGTPIGHYHAWNHLGMVMRPLGVEITNHMNHHFDSSFRYYELKPRLDGAQMPSAFLCFFYALIPPLFINRIAKPKLQHWDQHFASPGEGCWGFPERISGTPVKMP